MRNKNIRYAGQCDISKCYPSIDRYKLMEFLRKYIKNEPLLELIEMLIMTFDTGLSIGSYLSQYDYKEISEPTGTLDLADVKATPEKYFNYGNEPKKTDTERIDTLEATTDDIILMMADLIGGEA